MKTLFYNINNILWENKYKFESALSLSRIKIIYSKVEIEELK